MRIDSVEIPFRPTRPLCCTKSSKVFGDPQFTTLTISGKSMPRPKAHVATITRSLTGMPGGSVMNWPKILLTFVNKSAH